MTTCKGFKQTHSAEYDETLSPIAMPKSIKILLTITMCYDYVIWQMDIETTILDGNLLEDMYMTQLEGFVGLENSEKLCNLKRFIYGLIQVSWI